MVNTKKVFSMSVLQSAILLKHIQAIVECAACVGAIDSSVTVFDSFMSQALFNFS